MKTIGISAPLNSSGLWNMLNTLGEVMKVRFEERTFGDDAGIDAWFLNNADRETLQCISRSDCSSYAVIRADQRVSCGESSIIEFSRHHTLPSILCGRRIKTDEASRLMSLPRQLENATVLASKAGAPVWAMQEVNGLQHHNVVLPVPELNDGESLFQYFHGQQCLQLLPLILFLRTLTEDQRWAPPPLQACFMIDDPNLHWRTYGFVDFAQIAEHAQMHNYHVSFATIPLDTWFVHKSTALLFQQYSDRLSLLIHGNNHTLEELAQPYTEEEQTNNLMQALRRIDVFERRSRVEVSRLMVPPHGACSENALRIMAQRGFEAACISRGSLRHYNGQATWLRTLGMRPSEIIRGLPVFHRVPLSGSSQNNILIAALLHQPIIAMGHHNDVAAGLQILADVSEFVNSLGTVHWTDMKRISRSCFGRRFDGKILQIRMFTKHIEVCVPEGINQIWIERPWWQGAESMTLSWRIMSKGSEWKTQRLDELIPAITGQKIEIVVELPISPFIDVKNVRIFHLWPVVRRQLTEVRDRLSPVLRRVYTYRSSRS